jgi:transposase
MSCSLSKVHDVMNDDQTCRHLNFFQYKTYIRARLPRIYFIACKKNLIVKVDRARPQAGFIFLFDAHVLNKGMPVAAVAREIKEHDARL